MIRLSKIMASRGICSRREADEYIAKGWVVVDGTVVDVLGTKVSEDAVIVLDRRASQRQKAKVTIAVNKPIGYVSSPAVDKGYKDARDLITPEDQWRQRGDIDLKPEHLKKLAVAGRLDIDSKGLMLFTQDGTVAKKLIGDNTKLTKEYLVRVEGDLSDEGMELLRYGLELDGLKLRPAEVEWINDDQLRFVLRQGRKRQIRRMCEAVGLEVTGLKRVRVGNIMLGNLPEGMWRFVGEEEIE
ncbi:MAG: rRNA pseudouridine synthase [Waddliaceae bacterium]|jgi:23S rRNA pseudouridine2604 synthase|nr:rRNA pseudouridine synthase [Waddliaceae bacterium]MBT3578516.1 rRNA pseudouridine synthase [Waddliaceae bacterium]MBT4444896.1 rRNA pseudouridine synthase [Waddliaceae bacterium]MBT6928732.1 rRNA pseudouridine synthase [Waddliaceae bacterium]MBT7264750.1 rRNA pseudouridine synthase [Waddliaceae bacterium]